MHNDVEIQKHPNGVAASQPPEAAVFKNHRLQLSRDMSLVSKKNLSEIRKVNFLLPKSKSHLVFTFTGRDYAKCEIRDGDARFVSTPRNPKIPLDVLVKLVQVKVILQSLASLILK